MDARVCNVLVMGVSGVGKTTVAQHMAAAIGGVFLEADIHHPAENIRSMQAGIPLTDTMRARWLDTLCEIMTGPGMRGQGPVVLACSALKRRYRARLAQAMAPHLVVHLTAAPALIHARLTARRDHFMPPALLDSQLRDLEPPTAAEGAVVDIDVTETPEAVLARALSAYRGVLGRAGQDPSRAPQGAGTPRADADHKEEE